MNGRALKIELYLIGPVYSSVPEIVSVRAYFLVYFEHKFGTPDVLPYKRKSCQFLVKTLTTNDVNKQATKRLQKAFAEPSNTLFSIRTSKFWVETSCS